MLGRELAHVMGEGARTDNALPVLMREAVWAKCAVDIGGREAYNLQSEASVAI